MEQTESELTTTALSMATLMASRHWASTFLLEQASTSTRSPCLTERFMPDPSTVVLAPIGRLPLTLSSSLARHVMQSDSSVMWRVRHVLTSHALTARFENVPVKIGAIYTRGECA